MTDRWLGARTQRDLITDAHHAHHRANDLLDAAPLIVPFDVALQRGPAMIDCQPDPLQRHQRVPLQCFFGTGGDVGIASLVVGREFHVEFERNRLHAGHAASPRRP